MKEYRHVVVDKTGKGVLQLMASLDQDGLQTARTRGLRLPLSSEGLEHHLHVFVWDGSAAGIKGFNYIASQPDTIQIKIRWDHLVEDGVFFSGTLKGDTMQLKPPGGVSTNGAWAFKGNIPRKYLYIENLDSPVRPGIDNWIAGKGWT
jgi:hypothetical protein